MSYSEYDHMQSKDPTVTKVYEKLIKELKKFAELKIDPKKTSIHLVNRFTFAGIYTRSNYINIEFHLKYKLSNKNVSNFL